MPVGRSHSTASTSNAVIKGGTTSSSTNNGAGTQNVTPRKTCPLEHESPLVLDDDLASLAARRNTSSSNLSFTVVWSPLPPITWLIPFIGHTGICDSSGVASDFQGPYFVGDDGRMAFGAPTRYLKFHVEQPNTAGTNGGISSTGSSSSTNNGVSVEQWDDAIQRANDVYRRRMHNICCDNCHSHVAYALNDMSMRQYGVESWDMVQLAALIFVRASFVSWGAVVGQFLPCTLLVALIVYLNS